MVTKPKYQPMQIYNLWWKDENLLHEDKNLAFVAIFGYDVTYSERGREIYDFFGDR